mgnify:CR=1 FL=1
MSFCLWFSKLHLFIKNKEDKNNEPFKLVQYELINDHWEIGVALSENGFQQISFVNNIATTCGGTHVEYITNKIIDKLNETINDKIGKTKVNIKPHKLRNHLSVFVNCLIEKPTFDSQTKEAMTLQSKNFGSECVPSEKFFQSIMKIGIVDSFANWICIKKQFEMDNKLCPKKTIDIKGLPNLQDAKKAGTIYSLECMLIITEGVSTKNLVNAGFSVGLDKFGVFSNIQT